MTKGPAGPEPGPMTALIALTQADKVLLRDPANRTLNRRQRGGQDALADRAERPAAPS
jgi:hypothetical protein